MTILNDKEIRQRCLVPTHVIPTKNKLTYWTETDGGCFSVNNGLFFPRPNNPQITLDKITDEQLEDFLIRNPRMITPFVEKLQDKNKISYGLSSFGYDATCADTFKVVDSNYNGILDPKDVDPKAFKEIKADTFIIPPHGFVLTYTKEIFDMPEDVLSICMAKSTLARVGLVVGVTPLEPGWRGQVTIELSNTTDLPIKVYSHEGICQFLFYQGNSAADISYKKRNGKYMDQRGIVLPTILK